MTLGILTIIVFITAIATFSLWQQAARKKPKPKRKFADSLLYSDPIMPNHESPKIIGEDFSSLVTEEHQLFFEHFVDFAKVVNLWLANEHVGGPWRLLELSNTLLRLDSSDTPDFGRRYAVFYNQVQLGTLEVSPNFPYSIEDPNVVANLELNYVQLLSFDSVQSFLTTIALHLSNPDPNTTEYFLTCHNIDRSLIRVLWQSQQVSELDMADGILGELELHLNGSASWYFARRQILRKRTVA